MIKTAILVFVLIVIAVVIFYIGMIIGCWYAADKYGKGIGRALDECDLTSEQKIDILDNIKKEVRNK